MNAQSEITPNETDEVVQSTCLYSALALAQAEMGKALKDSTNPHFKSKYADLASVMDACIPSLSKNGIAVLQPPFDDETGRFVKTILAHGASGETLECRVPLIIGKNDMQGYGSAVTYARRYGLMSMAGIAPDDDDGNAAAASAPKPPSSAHMKREIEGLETDFVDAETEAKLGSLWRVWAAKMNSENWPGDNSGEDDSSFRSEVLRRFSKRKKDIKEYEAELDRIAKEQEAA